MKRKISKVVNHVKLGNEDELDVLYWLSKSATERIAEVTRLRVGYYTALNGSYPEQIAKVVTYRKLAVM